jgi:hypothetical protein
LQAQIQWEPDVRLTNASGNCYTGSIESYGDTIYIIFRDNRQPAGTDVYFMRSTDMGITWSDEIAVSPLDTNTSWGENFFARGETIHVVYADARIGGYWTIYYRRSIDGGETWETEQRLSPLWRSCSQPGITLGDSQDVFVILKDAEDWPDLITLLKQSTDAGVTWLPENLIDSMGYGSPFDLIYDQNTQTLHFVTWALPGPPANEVFYRRSTDQGVIWSDYEIISPLDSSGSSWPAMCVDSLGNLYVVWKDYKYSPYPWTGDIFLSRSTDNGINWLPYQQLTDVHRAIDKDVCVSGDTVYVVWDDDRHGFNENSEIYFRMSTNQGETWLSEERLTYAETGSTLGRCC